MPNRTICVTVAEVLNGGTKTEFYRELRQVLEFAVKVANLAMSHCVRQDSLDEAKSPKIYTYPVVSKIKSGVSNQVSSICRCVEKNYKMERYQVVRGKVSVRSYRSQPWPLLHNKGKATIQISDQGEFLTARIKLEKWWTVRLSSGSNYRDQIRTLRRAIAGDTYGDSKIWVDRKHKAIIGVSVDVPKDAVRTRTGSLNVSTSRESLLVCSQSRSDIPFVINCDEVHAWQAKSNKAMQRLRQDRKSGANRRQIRNQMNMLRHKMDNKVNTLCHAVAKRVIDKANRLNAATIVLDFTIKSYCQSFTWYDLASKIKQKAEVAGIEVVDATQTVVEPDVTKPHVYFKLSPMTSRIKIGMTGRTDGGRHGSETDSPEELVVLAVDNQPKNKLLAKEKHYHALFQEHCVKGEWFRQEPVLAWLREVGWLGNAGNLSEIAQVLDVSQDASSERHLKAYGECFTENIAVWCSHKAVKNPGLSGENLTALGVTKRTLSD